MDNGILCLCRHFAIWYENMKAQTPPDFAEPCIGCPNQANCSERNYPWLELIGPILDSVGVKISLINPPKNES